MTCRVEHRAARWESVLTAGDSVVAVATVDDHVVGFACVSQDTTEERVRDWVLESIYLLESQHGGGAGQALLDAVLGDQPA